MLLQFDWGGGGPFFNNTPIFSFDFHPSRERGYPWDPQGASDQKVE